MAMQQAMMERQMAIQIGRARDNFYWLSAFTGTYSFIAITGQVLCFRVLVLLINQPKIRCNVN